MVLTNNDLQSRNFITTKKYLILVMFSRKFYNALIIIVLVFLLQKIVSKYFSTYVNIIVGKLILKILCFYNMVLKKDN